MPDHWLQRRVHGGYGQAGSSKGGVAPRPWGGVVNAATLGGALYTGCINAPEALCSCKSF